MPARITTLSSKQDKQRQIGEYRLEQREGSPNWHAVRYDEEKKSNVWLSLRVDDFVIAQRKVIALVAANPTQKRRDPSEVELRSALDWYWENHARHAPSSVPAKIALRFWNEYWKKSTKIEDLNPVKVNKFVRHLRAKKKSEGYISRILSVGRSALNAYRDNLFVTWVPRIKDNQTQADKDEVDPKGRPLSLEELALLVRKTEEPHLSLFIGILLNTICRPGAALELTRSQVDFGQGRVELNPKGRRQTKKYRPVVPLTNYLRKVLLAAGNEQAQAARERGETDFQMGHYILYRGVPVKKIKTAWRAMVVKAGFVLPEGGREEITPYSLRHTMARVLREARVYEEERNVYLGHKRRGSARTGAIYAPDHPKYLSEPAAVIDEFMDKLHTEIARQKAAERQAAA